MRSSQQLMGFLLSVMTRQTGHLTFSDFRAIASVDSLADIAAAAAVINEACISGTSQVEIDVTRWKITLDSSSRFAGYDHLLQLMVRTVVVYPFAVKKTPTDWPQ